MPSIRKNRVAGRIVVRVGECTQTETRRMGTVLKEGTDVDKTIACLAASSSWRRCAGWRQRDHHPRATSTPTTTARLGHCPRRCPGLRWAPSGPRWVQIRDRRLAHGLARRQAEAIEKLVGSSLDWSSESWCFVQSELLRSKPVRRNARRVSCVGEVSWYSG